MRHTAGVLGRSAWEILQTMYTQRRILAAVARLEMSKRYAGSVLGHSWIVLQPALLLAIYLFVYMVVFKVRFPGYGEMDYVLFVFCGIIPYLGFSESLANGCASLKQNLHLVKNVMLPVELVPIRAVLVSLASQLVSLGILLLLTISWGALSPNVVALPLVVFLQMLLLIGLVLILSSAALVVPDVSYFVNLVTLLLFFISPIGYKVEMVPAQWQFVVYFNPIYYMTEAYRTVLLADYPFNPLVVLCYILMCLTVFAAGCAFFVRFKSFVVDYE